MRIMLVEPARFRSTDKGSLPKRADWCGFLSRGGARIVYPKLSATLTQADLRLIAICR
jgi:hypothetical protein